MDAVNGFARYEVTVNGVKTVLKLTAEDVKRYPDAVAVDARQHVPVKATSRKR